MGRAKLELAVRGEGLQSSGGTIERRQGAAK